MNFKKHKPSFPFKKLLFILLVIGLFVFFVGSSYSLPFISENKEPISKEKAVKPTEEKMINDDDIGTKVEFTLNGIKEGDLKVHWKY